MTATNAAEVETLDDWASRWDEIGLSTTAPGEDASTISEPVGNGYLRLALDGSQWSAATSGDPSFLSNSAEIEFAAASGGNWGTISYALLFESSVLKHYVALATPKAVEDTDVLRFAVAAVVIRLD